MPGRPRKSKPGSREWARAETRRLEERLREVRRRLAEADDAEFGRLAALELRIQAALLKLSREAAPQVVTEPWYGDSRALEELMEDGDAE
jgi:hypothetical protein